MFCIASLRGTNIFRQGLILCERTAKKVLLPCRSTYNSSMPIPAVRMSNSPGHLWSIGSCGPCKPRTRLVGVDCAEWTSLWSERTILVERESEVEISRNMDVVTDIERRSKRSCEVACASAEMPRGSALRVHLSLPGRPSRERRSHYIEAPRGRGNENKSTKIPCQKTKSVFPARSWLGPCQILVTQALSPP